MKKIKKKIPIYAGMEFTYPGTKNNRIKIIGYKIIEFTYNNEEMLIAEKEIKRELR